MLLSVAIQRYLRHHRTSGSSPHTQHWHAVSLGQFLAVAGDKSLEDLEAEDLRAWLDTLREAGLAQHTLRTRHRSLKALGGWLVAEEYLPKHPFAKVARPQVDDSAQDRLTPQQVKCLLAQPDKATLRGLRDYAMLCVLYSTGLRAEELCALKLTDIDEANQLLTVQRGKGGKFRQVPYLRRTERAVNKYLDHPRRMPSEWLFTVLVRGTGRMTPNNLGLVISTYGKVAGLAVRPHMLRHSFAVEYLRNGGSMADLQQILGHSDIKITQHYGRIAGVDLVRRHEKVDPLAHL